MNPAPRPNLSFCTLTDDPIATALAVEDLRSVADEIVVAVDARVADQVDALSGVDRLFVVNFTAPLERMLPWLHAQCTGRWRLRLDADEVPSEALLAALPDLIAAPDVAQYYISRRWLYRDADTVLANVPWFPDFQLRLIRNDPATDMPPGTIHEVAPVGGAARFLEQCIYHLDLLQTSYEDRARKAGTYERIRPGVRADDLGVNAGFYLPELRAPADLAVVPEEDRKIIARHLAGQPPTQSGTVPRPEHVDQQEIDRLWPERDLPQSTYHGRVELFGPPPVLVAGHDHTVFVRVTNEGTEIWPRGAKSRPEIRLGNRFRTSNDELIDEGDRSAFPAQLLPGETALVPVLVHTPKEPGAYVLEIDIVQEHTRWWLATCSIEITVRRPRQMLFVAGYSPFRHVGDDAIVRAHVHRLSLTAPEIEAVLLASDPGPIYYRFRHASEESIHRVLYEGIDLDRERDEVRAHVIERVDALVEDAVRFRAGTPPADERQREFFERVAASEGVVFASGGSLTSRYAIPELWPQMATAIVAHALGTRVVFSGVTVGPIDEAGDRELVRRGFEPAELIVVRDRSASVATLRECGVTNTAIVEEADPSVALAPAPDAEVDRVLIAAGLTPPLPFVAVSLRTAPEHTHDLASLAALLDHTWRYYRYGVLLLPHCTNPDDDDREAMEKLVEQLDSEVPVHRLEPLPRDDVVKGIVGRASLAVGSRYHLAVFAASSGVPAIGLYADDYAEQKLKGAAEFDPALVAVVPADIAPDPLIAVANRLLGTRTRPEPAMTNDLRALSRLLS